MRSRRTALALALATAAVVGGGGASAQAATTCTWAGTPVAPTGTFTIKPGLTNVPSSRALKFVATGRLGGGPACRGTVRFVSQIDAGSTCAYAAFEGVVKGLPGVARSVGRGSLDVPSLLYDRAGRLVGVENAQILTRDNFFNSPDCSKPSGFTGPAGFSSTITLFGAR